MTWIVKLRKVSKKLIIFFPTNIPPGIAKIQGIEKYISISLSNNFDILSYFNPNELSILESFLKLIAVVVIWIDSLHWVHYVYYQFKLHL